MPADRIRVNDKRNGQRRAARPERAKELADEMPVALSYDDVLLLPVRSSITSRRLIDTSAQLTRNVRLRIPIVSANMDTVTEAPMAVEMGRQGGIGIIHRFLSIEAQADEIRKVKRAESFVIAQPYTVTPDQTVEQ